MSSEFTARDKADCAQREVTQRVRVYKRLVEAGRMSERTAMREIDTMQSIADDYERIASEEEKKGRLL